VRSEKGRKMGKRREKTDARKKKRDADMEQLKGEGRGPYSPVRSLKTMFFFFEMLHLSFSRLHSYHITWTRNNV
jgi:hypothetical protein